MNALTHKTLLALAALPALSLLGQTTGEEQMRAKHAAEIRQRAFSAQAAKSPTEPNGQAAREKKEAAEGMHLALFATAGANRLVTGKPFSAEAATETVQTLADGNRIVRHNFTRYSRDRLGRTRREQAIESLGPSNPVAPVHLVVISDPVAKTDTLLDPGRKAARKFPRVEIVGAPANAAASQTLGRRTIEGLDCIGSSKTVTLPAGSIGNLQPIVATTETWYAPAIEAVVFSRTSDPRFGETTYALRNVVLTEQPASLFVAPPDYTVEFEGRPGVMSRQLPR